jgi:transcriptional regulator with XRE-family HTH domain
MQPRPEGDVVPAAVDTQADLVARIVELRQQSGLKQKQLAEAIGIDPASMNRVEKGERAVSVVELVRLATVLDVRVEELLAPPEPAPSIWLRASGESSAAVSESLSLFRDVIRDFFGARATVG